MSRIYVDVLSALQASGHGASPDITGKRLKKPKGRYCQECKVIEVPKKKNFCEACVDLRIQQRLEAARQKPEPGKTK